jgi:hypothetical protein
VYVMRPCIQHIPAVAVSITEILRNSAHYINIHIQILQFLLKYFHAWPAHAIDHPFATSLQIRYDIDCK